MLVQHQTGNRCQGLYRGIVLQHLPHGRLKVYVYGVYDEEYIDHPELLPICEQITPLWGGSYNGNGSFSYPNIGSTVWIQFANDDVNYPVAIGATLGGQNAYNQYNNIKSQTEKTSNKHLFTTGMAHFQMHESGKISSYVQQPFDNDVSINFENGDISCKIIKDVADKIENNEISHIVCQNVLDNSLNNGEISSSTHFFNIFDKSYTQVLSDTQEAITSSDKYITSFINYDIKNNLGYKNNNQLCSISIDNNYIYANNEQMRTLISSNSEKCSRNDTETLNISGNKNLNLINTKTASKILCDIDLQKSCIELSTHDNDSSNIAHSSTVNSAITDALANNAEQKDIYVKFDNQLKELSAIIAEKKNSIQLNEKLDNSLESKTVNQTFANSHSNIYIYANDTAKEIVLSAEDINLGKNNKQDHTLNNQFAEQQNYTLTDEQLYLKLKQNEQYIYTCNITNDFNTANGNYSYGSIIGNVVSSEHVVSTKTDILKNELTAFDQMSTFNAINSIGADQNILLNTSYNYNIESSFIHASDQCFFKDDTSNENIIACTSLGDIQLAHSLNDDYQMTVIKGGEEITSINTTIDNNFSLKTDGTFQIIDSLNIDEKLTYFGNTNESLSVKVANISADNLGHILINADNLENKYNSDVINKNSKFELFATKDSSKILLHTKNKVKQLNAGILMSLDDSSLCSSIENNTLTCYSDMSLKDKAITISIDNQKSFCKIKMNDNGQLEITASGELILHATENLILSSEQNIEITTPSIKLNSTVEVDGELIVNGIAMTTHIHDVSYSGITRSTTVPY